MLHPGTTEKIKKDTSGKRVNCRDKGFVSWTMGFRDVSAEELAHLLDFSTIKTATGELQRDLIRPTPLRHGPPEQTNQPTNQPTNPRRLKPRLELRPRLTTFHEKASFPSHPTKRSWAVSWVRAFPRNMDCGTGSGSVGMSALLHMQLFFWSTHSENFSIVSVS